MAIKILYEPHRNLNDLIKHNQSNYCFINIHPLHAISSILSIPFSKKKTKIYSFIFLKLVRIVNPEFILSVNWLTIRQKLFYIYSRNKPKTKFIVFQHGAYKGGDY